MAALREHAVCEEQRLDSRRYRAPFRADLTAHHQELQDLVGRVRQGAPDAAPDLLELVSALLEPYYRCWPGQDPPTEAHTEIAAVCDLAWNAIQEGALLRPEFLPSFVETLAWQQIKKRVPTPRLEIVGGRKARR